MAPAKPTAPAKPATTARKLSFKEIKELESLPEKIENLEAEIAGMNDQMGRPEFYQQSKDAITLVQAKIAESERTLAMAYARWEELEALREAAGA